MFVLALGKLIVSEYLHELIKLEVLHPYYKLAYIKLAWGGPEE